MAREPYTVRRCIHYRNSYSPCKANVDVEDLADDAGRVPCVEVRGVSGSCVCDLRTWPAEQQVERGPMSKMLGALLEHLCPTCGEEIVSEMEWADSKVALPCRHVIRNG